jgi:hypothetical protein
MHDFRKVLVYTLGIIEQRLELGAAPTAPLGHPFARNEAARVDRRGAQ